jgi:peptide deformylase
MSNVVMAPNKILRTVSMLVLEEEYPYANQVLDKMSEVMYANGGIGLAAIQIGLPKRMIIVDIGGEYGRELIKMVNPVITESSDDTSLMKEGCLSVPTIWELIERPKNITVEYLDENLSKNTKSFSGFQSHIVSHEMDHLDGITILDKISRLKRNMYTKKIKKYRKKLNRTYSKIR